MLCTASGRQQWNPFTCAHVSGSPDPGFILQSHGGRPSSALYLTDNKDLRRASACRGWSLWGSQ